MAHHVPSLRTRDWQQTKSETFFEETPEATGQEQREQKRGAVRRTAAEPAP
jgi:hypothetical protein